MMERWALWELTRSLESLELLRPLGLPGGKRGSNQGVGSPGLT